MQATTFDPPGLSEIVYFNGGQIYRSSTPKQGSSVYIPGGVGGLPGILASEKFDGKKAFVSHEYAAFFGAHGSVCIDLAPYKTCPAVTLWLCLGAKTPSETLNYDVYFAVDSTSQLRLISDHYGLPYPLDERIGRIVDTAPETVCAQNAGGRPIIYGGVKFVDGLPRVLKVYINPKPFGVWDVWMYGVSYCNGGLPHEAGAVFTKLTGGADVEGANMRGEMSFRQAEVIETKRADGVSTRYMFTHDADKFLDWKGVETGKDGLTRRVKRYESSQAVRVMIGRWRTGPTFEEYGFGDDTPFWLGRAYYDNDPEEELLFAITGGSAQLDAIAAHYGLPLPYSDDQKQILDTQPELYRARHYDLFGLGEGNYVPVVVGSVTFVAGQPARLLLYTFMRPWDFDEKIQLPAFPS